MNEKMLVLLIVLALIYPPGISARQSQDKPSGSDNSMPGMQHEHGQQQQKKDQPMQHGHDQSMQHEQDQSMHHGHEHMQPSSFTEEILFHSTPGTSAEPNSTPVSMLMTTKGDWSLMFHGEAFLNVQQQSGPRGTDKVFSTNWFMPMAHRQLGNGHLTLRAMMSLEPATVTHRFYPELFQQGETAFGRPIIDGQHPHDFSMELAALYDLKLSENALLSFYAAPVGDPAMGPTAYAHRSSASEDPLATLGHHLQDSTHIADDVLTAGLTYKMVRLEASGFHGREPDEFRWDIDAGKIDSWSARLTIQPGKNWSGQYSFAHLTSPEELHPLEDTQRMTASIMYNRPLQNGNWASTLLWGRNRGIQDNQVFNSYLAESTLQFADRHHVWGRIENTDRTDELLLPNPIGPEEAFLARVQAYTLGYDYEFKNVPYLRTALGAQLTFYDKPAFLNSVYSEHPFGAVLFLRLRPAAKPASDHTHM
jgi:hypothetical protein